MTIVTMALACATDSTADITTMAVAPLAMDRKEESLPMEEVAVMATCTIARVAFVIIKTYLTKIPTRCLDVGAVVHVPLLHSLHPTTTEAGVGVSVVADRIKFLITDPLSTPSESRRPSRQYAPQRSNVMRNPSTPPSRNFGAASRGGRSSIGRSVPRGNGNNNNGSTVHFGGRR